MSPEASHAYARDSLQVSLDEVASDPNEFSSASLQVSPDVSFNYTVSGQVSTVCVVSPDGSNGDRDAVEASTSVRGSPDVSHACARVPLGSPASFRSHPVSITQSMQQRASLSSVAGSNPSSAGKSTALDLVVPWSADGGKSTALDL